MCVLQPFYGGKKNQIVTEIFAPKDKKPFCTIRGEWNGHMTAKFDDATVSEKHSNSSIIVAVMQHTVVSVS